MQSWDFRSWVYQSHFAPWSSSMPVLYLIVGVYIYLADESSVFFSPGDCDQVEKKLYNSIHCQYCLYPVSVIITFVKLPNEIPWLTNFLHSWNSSCRAYCPRFVIIIMRLRDVILVITWPQWPHRDQRSVKDPSNIVAAVMHHQPWGETNLTKEKNYSVERIRKIQSWTDVACKVRITMSMD